MKHPPAFHIMAKPTGAICNLECAYCFYLEKEGLYPDGSFRMNDAVLESFSRQYIQGQQVRDVTFSWQGGEPTLMGLDFFERAVAYQQKYCKPGMRIHNTIQTNGMLLDNDWGAFLKKHNFLVGISIDGPAHLHDLFRKDKGGGPSFDKVNQGLTMLKKHQVPFNILCCVNAENGHYPLEVYRFLRDELTADYIQFIPIVEQLESGEAAGWSVTGEVYGQFLISVFDEWLSRDVGKVFVQIFDIALGIWVGQPAGLCIFGETCGTALALEHNGDLYACDHYVDPDRLLGNIGKDDLVGLVESEAQIQFGQEKFSLLSQYCLNCEVLFACNGGCPKNRFDVTPDGEAGLNYLCAGYKAFFRYIDGPMKRMAQQLRGR